MVKVCISCNETKPDNNFIGLNVRSTRTTKDCFLCRLKWNDYLMNKRKLKPVYKLWKIWKSQPCKVCGCKDAIEADHVRGTKIKELSNMAYWIPKGIEAWKKEAEKCDPMCRFHHRLATYRRQKKKGIKSKKRFNRGTLAHQKRRYIDRHKLKLKYCAICRRKCTEHNKRALDLDHINPETKTFNIAMLAQKNMDVFNEHIDEELKKCRLLCVNCHFLHTNQGQRRAYVLVRTCDTCKKELPIKKFQKYKKYVWRKTCRKCVAKKKQGRNLVKNGKKQSGKSVAK